MLYEKMVKTNENRDVDSFLDMIDEEFVMVSHQNKTERTKQEFAEMVRAMMSSDSLEVTNQRCIYENDDVLVEHSNMSFPDGSQEAVLAVWTKRKGKFVRVETGATPIK
tara:strand:- start:1211 stop:1537 length:327 start_codon:yes stop_codon:yes gene_type:complete